MAQPRPFELINRRGHNADISVFQDLVVGERSASLSESFHTGVINTVSLRPAVTANGGTVSITDGMLTANTGTATNGSASLRTRRTVRYRPGYASVYLFTARFTAGTPDATQWIGPLSASDGFAIGMNGIEFSILWRRGGVDTIIGPSSFDRDLITGIDAAVLNPARLNLFRIDFGYLGIAPVTFSWYAGADYGWVPFFYLDLTNARTTPHVTSPNLPMQIVVAKTAGSTNVSAASGSWFGGLIGNAEDETANRHGALQSGFVTLAANTTRLLALVRNVPTYGGQDNTVSAFMRNLNAATDGTRSVQFRLLLQPTITGTPSWTNYDATNSIIQFDTTLTGISVTGGRLVGALNVEKAGSGNLDIPINEASFEPGEVLALTAVSTGNNDIGWQLEWDELF